MRFGAERKFGNDGALRGNLLIKGKIFCRVNDVRAGSEHRHRRPVLFKRIHGAFVRSRVNAPRHAGDNQNAGAGQIVGNPGGQFAAVNRSVARADDGNGRRPIEDVGAAFDVKKRGRVFQFAQFLRIFGIVEGQNFNAFGAGQRNFAFGGGKRGRMKFRRQAAQSVFGTAACFQQFVKGNRPDAVGVNQAEPGENFRIRGGQGYFFLKVILLSSPLNKRRILA